MASAAWCGFALGVLMRRDAFERHLRAAESRDLTPRRDACDVDRLTAAGMVAQYHGLGMALYRLKYLGDGEQARDCLLGVYRLLRAYMERRRIKGRALDIAREVLVWWTDDLCVRCDGRRLVLIPGTGRLSAKQCGHCHGSGIEPLAGDAFEARQYAAARIDIMVSAAQAALQRRDR